MDFCHALANQGKEFKFSITIGSTFTFSLDTREGKETLPARIKKSPSTLKRNAKRRQEFLMKKSNTVLADKESNQEPVKENSEFKCDHCDIGFKTRNGLKIHTGKTHKQSAKSPEKLRGESSSKLHLKVSPLRETVRGVPCHNCGEEMTMTHLCEEEAVEVEQGIGDDDVTGTPDGDQTSDNNCTCDCPASDHFDKKELELWCNSGCPWCIRKKINIPMSD